MLSTVLSQNARHTASNARIRNLTARLCAMKACVKNTTAEMTMENVEVWSIHFDHCIALLDPKLSVLLDNCNVASAGPVICVDCTTYVLPFTSLFLICLFIVIFMSYLNFCIVAT